MKDWHRNDPIKYQKTCKQYEAGPNKQRYKVTKRIHTGILNNFTLLECTKYTLTT